MARQKLATPTTVYIVERVLDYDGSEILSVHVVLENALATKDGKWEHHPATAHNPECWTMADKADSYFRFVITPHDLKP